MVRRIIVALLSLILRVFFRRIEVHGLERVPQDGAVMFLVNHPNGLVDPLFLFTLVPRRVSFLAKSTLFKMPVVGYFVRAVD
jgi:1-acyl-sn-glycerol-3-phosphate acyltransferase